MDPEVGLRLLRAQHLRCLNSIELETDTAQNIIVGANGAGKTSILEAIYFLGRGKSFRSGHSSLLIQTGQPKFDVFGKVTIDSECHRLGASQGPDGLDIHLNGQPHASVADLTTVLPVQIIDPEVHRLIQGGPKGRREFLDWGVFHVKHEFLNAWRRYRRALKQRNAALKQGVSRRAVLAWDSELVAFGLQVDAARRAYVKAYLPLMSSISSDLLQVEANCRYLPGWQETQSLADALMASWERDRTYGATQIGPHRAELTIEVEGHAARNRLSRGQQKLLSIALVLAQSLFVSRTLERKVTLLVDEPAGELDEEHLQALIQILDCQELQLFITTLNLDALPVTQPKRVFHVEHGVVSTLV